MKRQRGYSLAEIGMSIGIATVLAAIGAGAGLKVSNDSKSSQVIMHAEDLAQAVDRFMAQDSVLLAPTVAAQGNSADLNSKVGPFAKQGDTNYSDPWNSAGYNPAGYFSTATTNWVCDAAAKYANGYDSTKYPMDGLAGKPDNRGKVIYLYKGSAAFREGFCVWNGQVSYRLEWYAVQAIDNRGYPAITLGK